MNIAYKLYLKILVGIIVAIFFTGCSQGRILIEGEYGSVKICKQERIKRHSHKKIPPGHLPPPGKCRIWHPGVPPGHQPPPGNCHRLAKRVPHGAWLIQR